jgi:hypothetical protein
MCGIVGLFLKDRALEPELGVLLAGMLITMCDRGPDSAGFAVYGAGIPGTEAAVRAKIAAMPDLTLVGSGRRMEIFKEVGRPDRVAQRFGLDAMAGTTVSDIRAWRPNPRSRPTAHTPSPPARSVSRAQRFAVEPQCVAPRADQGGPLVSDRKRHRSRRRLHELEDAGRRLARARR